MLLEFAVHLQYLCYWFNLIFMVTDQSFSFELFVYQGTNSQVILST